MERSVSILIASVYVDSSLNQQLDGFRTSIVKSPARCLMKDGVAFTVDCTQVGAGINGFPKISDRSVQRDLK